MTPPTGTLATEATGGMPDAATVGRAGERLARFTPRKRKSGGGRGHSVMVGILKLLLPLIAVLLIVLVIMWPTIEEQVEAGGPTEGTPEFQASGEAQIINPRFTGLDEAGRPFEIEGDLAYQDIDNPELIDLDNLRGTINLSDDETARIESDFGHFDQNKGEVELRGNVVVSHDQGAVFRTGEIIVNINENHVWGNEAVEAETDEAHVTATGFEVLDGGATVIFRGPARMVIEQGAQPTSPSDDLVTGD